MFASPLLSRVGRFFSTKRVLPCVCSTMSELQLPPDSIGCPIPRCVAPTQQRSLGYTYGVEDECTVSPHNTLWYHSSSLPPAVTHEQPLSIPILLSHLPLHRHSSSCGSYPDSKPITPNFRLYSLRPWAVYSSTMPKQSSAVLLRNVQPLLVLSGDHHRWCTTVHSMDSNREVVEVTVGTFSWLQGSSKPSFGALLLTNSSESASLFGLGPGCVASSALQWHSVICPCWLPDNRFSLVSYAIFAFASMVWLLVQLGNCRAAIKTWLVTSSAAIIFHVLLV